MDTAVFGDNPPVVIAAGDLRINLQEQTVVAAGTQLRLKSREYALLVILGRAALIDSKRPVSREFILEVFDPKRDWRDTKVVQVYMLRVRKKLANVSGGREYIDTVCGKGYFLMDRAVAHYDKAAGV